ncbi:MAG: glycosyltransferase [Pseudolabrys sp.]
MAQLALCRCLHPRAVVAALYREAASIDGLLHAIERLDYPPEKLDVIIALEADDRDTRAAIATRCNRIPISVITVPEGGPRTKPKALNAALPFARGSFTVIYDAEDRPEPDQLRRALQAFRSGGNKLACVQARLCIDNTADSWLARMLTAEYAGQFDGFLPGLAVGHLPLPLGGSSNHFHTATLRAVGAWDPYNVTEDADLGMRLARLGYRAAMIASTTYEEAAAQFGPWLRQRTRWFKGWMQTWLVHMRTPRRLKRELGWSGFWCFQLIVGGNVLAALAHPLFLIGLATVALTGAPLWTDDTVTGVVLLSIYVSTATLGYLVSAGLGLLGLSRRGLAASAWVLLLTPLHWLLLSLAAWRALYQLLVAPYHWEKTEHGLARHSRLNDEMTRAPIKLEHGLAKLKKREKLPMLAENSRSSKRRSFTRRHTAL